VISAATREVAQKDLRECLDECFFSGILFRRGHESAL
jgi:hypothetical protein